MSLSTIVVMLNAKLLRRLDPGPDAVIGRGAARRTVEAGR